eukprot:CAMPEP_0172089770 /NCGR_PEP_ID=MMETSP1043-20130122/23990_1 /TAXON_ID=464988 /ORGANISM="Hemiselmis andersenii, Strain CCMP441" /LENGTH=152 /DNA_ID=CAMNT_0012752255 /DNA_START=40 /DNA_END=498 /DNA_ORIENTATION=+
MNVSLIGVMHEPTLFLLKSRAPETIDTRVHHHEPLQLISAVNSPDLLPQHPVQDLADGPRKHIGRKSEDVNQRDSEGSDFEGMARTDCLWNDFAKNGNGKGRDDEASEARRHVGHQDREKGVDGYISQKQGTKEEVSPAPKRENLFGILGVG